MKTRMIVLVVSASLGAQVLDPIPDWLRAQILQAKLNQASAEKDKQSAMMAYHKAENQFEVAKNTLKSLNQQAIQACEQKTFDSEKVICK